MAIITDNENFTYDEDERFYYLTEKALETLVGNANLINIWNNAPSRLKKHGRLLKNKLVKSAYNSNKKRFRHRDVIEYKVYLNQFEEVNAIIDALVIIAQLSDDIDWDKLILTNETKWFSSILSPCVDAGIYFDGYIKYEVPEDEYRVGY